MPWTVGRRHLMTATLAATTLGAAGSASDPGAGRPSGATPSPVPAPPRAGEVPDWADRVVAGMSLPRKVGQLFVTVVYGPRADSSHPGNREEHGLDTPEEVVRAFHPGGVIHFSWTDSLHHPRQIAELSNDLQRAALDSGAGLPLTIATDQEQGLVTRIGPPATVFAGNMAHGAARDPHLARRAAFVTGHELRAMGITQNFAPVGDVNVNPENPVIGVRSFGSDPELVARMTRAQVRGYQDTGAPSETVSAAVKHFPGHGDTTVDSHTALPVIEHTDSQWRRLDAPPFRAAISAGVDAVMTAHIRFPGLDDSGEPATLSRTLLTGLLREELGFDGVIVTDSLRMRGVRELHPDESVAVLALRAGADQLLMPPNLSEAVEEVVAAVRDGRLSVDAVDRSVARILRAKARRGVITDPLVRLSAVERVVGSPRNLREARRVTDPTVTLLRDDPGLLPLRRPPGRVLVTGWGTETCAELADRLRRRGSRVRTLPTGANPTEQDAARVAREAAGHDLVLVLTNAAWKEDRAGQRALARAPAEAGVPTMAVAVRDPYDAAHVERIGTWLTTYSHRPVAMESLVRVLFGEISPQGRLPVPVPDPQRPDTDRYPFGHGLSW
nr:glycoside hydrolase family 3 protein [Actinopolyspora mortivallis]